MSIYMIKYSKKDKTIRLLDSTNKQTKDVPESTLIDFISRGKISIENLTTENKQLKGTNGSIERYTSNALTVINTIKNQNETIGFELSDSKGNIKKLKYSDCLVVAKQYGLTNAKLTSSNDKELISSIIGEHESLDVTDVKQSNNKISLKEQIKQIKCKAIALGLKPNKVAFNKIIESDQKAIKILKYNEVKDSIQFIDYNVALKYPKYSIYVTDMSGLFIECKAKSIVLSSLDTSNVTNMSWMFNECKAISLDLSSFNTSKVRDMNSMFSGCQSKYINLASFDTSNVTNMKFMFDECKAQSLDLSSFDTSNVKSMNHMFSKCKAKLIDISSFNTSNVTNMGSMFSGCEVQSLDLSLFNTSNVTDMGGMFYRCKAQSLDLSSFDTSKVIKTIGMFSECEAKLLDLSSFDTSNVDMENMEDTFQGCKANLIRCSKILKGQVLNDGCQAQIEEV